MVKKGDIFVAHREGYLTENVMATADYSGEIVFTVNSEGEKIIVWKNEIGEVLCNINQLTTTP